jgi:hypothetical protein
MKTASIRVPDELWDGVRNLALSERTSANAVVLNALEAYLGSRRPRADSRRLRRLEALVGIVKGGPEDLADEHDEHSRRAR